MSKRPIIRDAGVVGERQRRRLIRQAVIANRADAAAISEDLRDGAAGGAPILDDSDNNENNSEENFVVDETSDRFSENQYESGNDCTDEQSNSSLFFLDSDAEPLTDDDDEYVVKELGEGVDISDNDDELYPIYKDDDEHRAFGDDTAERSQDFRSQLASWAVECQIKQVHVDKLLKLMTSDPKFESLNLPKTCRTLLQTVRQTPIKTLDPGHYYHFGICNGAKTILEKCRVSNINAITILVNIDGVPISKSSGSQFWPIQGVISNISSCSKKPFIIGIYSGNSKPYDVNLFQQDFVDEVLSLRETGLDYGAAKLQVVVSGFICDAPARAFITATKTHSGYFSCSKCTEEGEWHGRVVFLKEDAILRTNESFRMRTQEEHHIGWSILEQLGIDMVESFPLDYMHLVCLGVMRKLLWAWIRGPFSVRLRRSDIERLSSALVGLKEFIAVEFVRKPRTLDELPRWKATELRQFLLYTGPVLLKKILSKPVYKHFNLFHVAIKILATKNLCKDFNEFAEGLLLSFVDQCKELYGNEFMSYNVHNLIHLAKDVQRFGHLDAFSAFPFENNLQALKKLIRKHDKQLPQVIRRVIELERNSLAAYNHPEKGETILKKKHSNGRILNTCNGNQFKELHYKSWVLKANNAGDCCVTISDSTIIRIQNFVQNESGIYILGYPFTQIDNLFSYPLESSRLGVFRVRTLSPVLKSWPINLLKMKNLMIPTHNNSENSFAIFPLLMENNSTN